MRSRDLIDGFDYGEYMQRQMFCFGSDDDGGGAGGGQPDRSNPNEMRAREQSFVDDVYGGDSDNFISDVAAGVYSGLAAEEQAAAEAQAMAGLGNVASDRGVDAAAVNAALNNIAAAVTQEPKSTGGITAAQVAAMNAAQKGLGISPYSAPENVGYDPVTGMPIGGGNLAGLTREQYGAMPGYMQNIYDKTGAYNFEVSPKGQVTGFYGPPGGSPFPSLNLFGKGIVGLTDMLLGPPMTEEDLALRSVYTGFGEGSQPDGGRDNGPSPEIKPVSPVTGQCDEGYMFDEDLQACRLDTRGDAGLLPIAPPTPPAAPGTYARLGLLDVAPTGMSDFATRYGLGPQDFGAANLAYRRGAGTQFDIYKDPYQKEGFTLLS